MREGERVNAIPAELLKCAVGVGSCWPLTAEGQSVAPSVGRPADEVMEAEGPGGGGGGDFDCFTIFPTGTDCSKAHEVREEK